MSGPDQPPPEAPPGIDPEVQSRIDALFARSSTETSARRIFDPTTNNETVVSHSDATVTTPRDTIIHLQPNKDVPLPSTNLEIAVKKPVKRMEDDQDEGTWHDRTPWAPPPLPRPQTTANFTDPSKYLQCSASTQQTTLPAFLPTHAIPIPPHSPPPSLPTLFSNAISYIGSYFTSSPGIIEYSDAEIQQKTQVVIQAHDGISPSTEATNRIVKVVAILTDVSPTGFGEAIKRPVEIQAKHKRVREIKRGLGCYVAEEVYGKEIRAALGRLKR
jgi:hypothetical protein